MDRMEDLKQTRDLHLLRDERDREVEAAAQARAGRAVVLASQLLAAVCLLWGDPAWTVFLSLTFVSGAARSFCQYAQDREGIYLVLGLAAGAIALVLAGSYLHPGWLAGMSFTQVIGYAVLCWVLTAVAGLVFVGLLLGMFYLAHRIGHMEGERWEQYFRSVSTAGLLLRMGTVMALALGLVAACSCPLFDLLGFQEPEKLAALFLVAGGARLLEKFSRQREELIRKLLRLKR